ncbi:MAG: cellulose biosynthesis cyclic di-GMP-binding regulatory protein BcsB, partial [Pseudomonadota bacterium]|nr:cellulose biosynthesis cyclic di-GMP-binding regulatory protein BcsB [Pseudomonadota bacterium]
MTSMPRRVLRSLALCAGVVPAALPAPSWAQTAPAAQSGPVLTRDMTLAELGFRNGVTFQQLSGTQTVYFPVPSGPDFDRMELHLSLNSGATTPADRYVRISVGGRILASRGLTEADDSFALTFPIDASDVQSGFVPVRFDYSGANTERVCFDERMSGDFLTVAPDSGLRLTMAPDQVASSALFAGLKPTRTVIGLADNAGLADMAALTRAAALLGADQGLVGFGAAQGGPDWTVAQINIAATADGPVSDMRVAADGALPVLTVSGTDPQVGLAQLLSPWTGLTGEGRTVTSAANQPVAAGNRLPLAALGGDLSSRAVKGSEDFTVNFSASDIPPGKIVSDLSVTAVSGLDPDGNGATLSVSLNEVLLGSRTLSAGVPQNLSFAVPAGLIGSENTLRFHVQRQPVAGACRYTMQGYPAQILPGSALVLSDGSGEAHEFHELRQAAGQGVQLVIDRDLSLSSAELAPWLAGVAGSILPDRAPVVPRADM